jgi:uncharacterized protein
MPGILEYFLIVIVAFGVSMLTFISGFGLGTILMPVFAIFFPVEIAIATTAVVHLANNLFKITLIWQAVSLRVLLWFGITAAGAAFLGAYLLDRLSGENTLLSYNLLGREMEVTVLKLVIALLLVIFALMEISKRLEKITMNRKFLPLGGLLSGFFGGLSGHQGALRSMFLLKAGLSKEGFIATGIAAAILIDISRLAVYGSSFFVEHFRRLENGTATAVIAATLAAFAGSFLGRKSLRKVTFRSVQLIVGILILVMALLLGAGII